ncbi:hypothetical protein DSC45_35050 [Streptomyces sp. YIM 130001]|uniref:hypothetical protein n=1 Tax=Streptomyces sp. YIM 130001 TaxID=2259644 RepID=UPI000E651863|nr:hypothetical protein DSC45_35050 [Streptomyces sp. YIM 130001]
MSDDVEAMLSNIKSTKIACRAITKKGEPCPIEAGPSGWCHVHDPELQCGAVNKKGKRCNTATGGGRCQRHTPNGAPPAATQPTQKETAAARGSGASTPRSRVVTVQAKFPGRCRCGDSYQVGETIAKLPNGWGHQKCAATQ